MTFMLGGVCTDGVVLVSDRKISSDTEVTYEDKLFRDIPPVIVGASGSFVLFARFRHEILTFVHDEAAKKEGRVGGGQFVRRVEDLVEEINNRLGRRVGDRFEVLMGVTTNGRSRLLHVVEGGAWYPAEGYRAIGSGALHGQLFLKRYWHDNITMAEAARIGFFIIHCIQQKQLDSMVGLGDKPPHIWPQVWYIPHGGTEPFQPKPDELMHLEGVVKRALSDLDSYLPTLLMD